MAEEGIAAEVMPADPGHAGQAAKALAQRGFRVLHVGRSISVQAPRGTWETTFGVAFATRTKTVQPELARDATYLRAEPGSVHVPTDLAELIAEVAFVEPPDLH